MKRINKIMSVALALSLTASIAAGAVVSNAEYDAPAIVTGDAVEADENGFIIENGVLTGYTGTGGVITIPDTVNSIGNKAFMGNTDIVKVTIPDSVTMIQDGSNMQYGTGAFRDCKNLVAVEGGKNIIKIGAAAFMNCSLLSSIVLSDDLMLVGKAAFSGCTMLKEITLPNKLTAIGESAFSDCSALAEITFPASLETISDGAFDGCRGLKEVTIPGKIKSIGDSAFDNCTNLSKVVLESGVTTLGSQSFNACTSLREITIPLTVTTMGWCSFTIGNGTTTQQTTSISISTVYYEGTKEQYEALIAANATARLNPKATVFCSDATINDYAKELTLTPPTKTNYLLNEELDLTGAKLAVKYVGLTPDETVNVTADMCTGFNSKTEGKKTVTVTYKGKTATFDVNVTKTPVIAVDSIAIATAPTKTTYKVGEELDVTGGKITVTYTGGKEPETIDITAAMCTGFDSTTEGTKTVTVTYEGKTATFEVTVKNSNIDNEGTVIEVGTGKECADLTAALAKINAAVKARSADTAYTLVLTDKAYSEKKALAFPALKVIIKGDEGTEITVPSVTAKGDLALENLTLKTAKGANAAVTAKKSLTAYNCTLGKTAVTGDALLDNCTTGALTAKANLTITGGTYELITASGKAGTKTTLNDAVTVTKNLTVSNDLVIVGNSTVGGKFTAKAGLNINGFTVKNGK